MERESQLNVLIMEIGIGDNVFNEQEKDTSGKFQNKYKYSEERETFSLWPFDIDIITFMRKNKLTN